MAGPGLQGGGGKAGGEAGGRIFARVGVGLGDEVVEVLSPSSQGTCSKSRDPPRPPRCLWSPEAGRDLAGTSLWRWGKGVLLPSAGAQVRSARLQGDPLGVFFGFQLRLGLLWWRPRGESSGEALGRAGFPGRNPGRNPVRPGRGLTVSPRPRWSPAGADGGSLAGRGKHCLPGGQWLRK